MIEFTPQKSKIQGGEYVKNIKYLSIVVLIILLSACSGNQVDANNAENTAEYIKKELGYDTEVEIINPDFENEGRVTYAISENVQVLENIDGGVEEVIFASIEEEEIDHILEIMDFPRFDAVDRVINTYNSTEYEEEFENLVSMEVEFLIHEEVGLYLAGLYVVRNSYYSEGTAPYHLIFTYNEEAFDYWINAADMFNDR